MVWESVGCGGTCMGVCIGVWGVWVCGCVCGGCVHVYVGVWVYVCMHVYMCVRGLSDQLAIGKVA